MRYLSILCTALFLITSCGGGSSSGGGGETVLTVSSTVPADNATNVSIETILEIHFSKEIDPTTVNASTITLSTGAESITGVLDCSGTVINLTPSFPLSMNSIYTATIAGEVKDISGNLLGSDYTWSFTTNGNIDTSNYYYQPGHGDEMIYGITIPPNAPTYKKSTFAVKNIDIPDQYSYQALEGLQGNPHILETTIMGDDPSTCTDIIGRIYYTLDGKKIIDDHRYSAEPPVWLFTNIDHTTITGDEEPESVVTGREYESTVEEILFNQSNPPVEVGTRTITTTIVPQDIVSVTVLGTTYEALRITTESFSEETIDGSTTSLTGSGTLWLGRNTGLVKTQMEYTSEEEGGDPVSYDYLVELFDITLSSDAVLPASLQTSLPTRTTPLHSFMKNIFPTHRPSLP